MRSRILVLGDEAPLPAHTGKRLRTLNLLSRLAVDHEIELVVHRNGLNELVTKQLLDRGITVHAASDLPAKSGLRFGVRLLSSLVRGIPYSVHSHCRPAYARLVTDLLRRRTFDLVHCEWTPYATYLDQVQRPVVIAAHNVEWQVWNRLADAADRWPERLLLRRQARTMERFERRTFARWSHVTAVSEADRDLLQAMGARHVTVVPNGVDLDLFAPQPASAETILTLVFTGSMDWRPNQDAVRWFIDQVHPRLAALLPYRLLVVGRQPPEWLNDPKQRPSELIVTGTVDDIRPWYAQGHLFVVPLRAGGGSRLKILEAMAVGRAVISTTIGAEGIAYSAGIDLEIADEADQFVERIVALWQNPARREALARAGRRLVEARYGWDEIARLQTAAWQRALATEPASKS